MSLAQKYTALRTGRAFLWGMCIFCALWVIWNILPDHLHFDDSGFDRLTLVLSVEASIAASFIIAANEKQAAENLKRDLYILQLMEAVHAILKKNGTMDKPHAAATCDGVANHEAQT